MTTENNEYKFSLKTIVIVLFAVITLVGGAVYAVVKLSMDDKKFSSSIITNRERKRNCKNKKNNQKS